MFELARERTQRGGMRHAGWAYDAYPELEMLDANTTMTVADLSGPGVLARIHVTDAFSNDALRQGLSADEVRALGARGIVLEILYDGEREPAVSVPLADFFADGCGGRGTRYSTLFVEKAPGSYNCLLPLPYRERIVVRLRNDTPFNMLNYTYVEFTPLEAWDPSLWHLHARWDRRAFQLAPDTDEPLLHIDGPGHLVGQSWSISTDDPLFHGFHYVMEGNNEFRLDGEATPSIDYLGTEDAFGFSWGFQAPFAGLRCGIPYVSPTSPVGLSAYRFRDADAIFFASSLDLRVNWTHEFRTPMFEERIAATSDPGTVWLPPSRDEGRGWIDYATTFYWYAPSAAGAPAALPPLEQRTAEVLRPNELA